jgi:hypothetical protein
MSAAVHTGWRSVVPGNCSACGYPDGWTVDGRGNVMCECEACPDCGCLDAYGFHDSGCPVLTEDTAANDDEAGEGAR